jgi:hypothetical protein
MTGRTWLACPYKICVACSARSCARHASGPCWVWRTQQRAQGVCTQCIHMHAMLPTGGADQSCSKPNKQQQPGRARHTEHFACLPEHALGSLRHLNAQLITKSTASCNDWLRYAGLRCKQVPLLLVCTIESLPPPLSLVFHSCLMYFGPFLQSCHLVLSLLPVACCGVWHAFCPSDINL